MANNGEAKKSSSSGEARVLLLSAAGAFGVGLLGAIWHTQRKQAREIASTLSAPQTLSPSMSQAGPVRIAPPSTPTTSFNPPLLPAMTAAEYAASKRDARFFAVKTLGYGTLLAFAGAGVLSTAVGFWLDVRNFQEFSDKLRIIVPRQTARLRTCLGGKALEITPQENEELEAFNIEE